MDGNRNSDPAGESHRPFSLPEKTYTQAYAPLQSSIEKKPLEQVYR